MDSNAIVKQIFSLEKMLVPPLLLWIYRVGLVLVVLSGLGYGVACFSSSVSMGILSIIIGIPLSLVAWRIWIELIYVLFGIYNQLAEINKKLK